MIKPSTLKIYNASAGSGKTYTLVKEFLSIVLQSNDYHYFRHILAITFTNKAASEMKERILKSLEKFATLNAENRTDSMFQEICTELNISEIQLSDRARKTLSAILHQYSNFSVSTIDKFTQRLVRNFTHDLGLSSNIEVEFDTKKLLQESVEMLLSKLGKEEQITNTIVQFSLSQLDDDKAWNITESLVKASEILLKEDDLEKIEQLKNHSLEDFSKLRTELKKSQHEIEKKLTSLGKKGITLINQNHIKGESFANGDKKGVHQYFNSFATGNFREPTSTHLKNFAENRCAAAKASASDKASIESIFEPLKLLFYEIVDQYQIIQSEYLVNQLILKEINGLSVINEIEKELSILKEENNILLGPEFNKIINEELKNQPAPYIYERIGEKYKHYFIDEFQDTSVLQFENLYPLIHNQLAQDGNALIVGDSKQSIYRWRGGDPEQFIQLTKDGKGLPFELNELKTNYRSHQNIVEFNNLLYSNSAQLFDNQSYTELYQTAFQENTGKENGYVTINSIKKEGGGQDKEKNSIYIDAQLNYILQTIRQLKLEGFDYQDITILVRNNKEGIKIAQFLSENNISIISKESLLLKNATAIQLTERVLQLLQYENDYQLRAALLIQLFQYKKLSAGMELHDLIQKIVKLPINRFFEALKPFEIQFEINTARSVSIYGLIEYIYQSFGLIAGNETVYLQYFLDFCLAYTVRKGNNLAQFLQHWDEKKEKESIATPDAIDAVQIMSIHKSKGLQFPVVILPFADWKAFTDEKSKIWMPLEKGKYADFDHFYIKADKTLEKDAKIGSQLIKNNLDQIQLDNLNILYVATTRAEERLYIVIDELSATAPKYSISYYLHNLIENKDVFVRKMNNENLIYTFGNKIHTPKEPIKTNLEPIHFHSINWKSILEISKTAPLFWNTEHENSVAYGNKLHTILAEIKYESDVDAVLQHHVLNGLITDNEQNTLKIVMLKLLNLPKLTPYFQLPYKVYNEREFYYQSEVLRPDRIVFLGKEATIIDYKTGEKKASHREQIKQYANALEALEYIINELILIYIDDEISLEIVAR